MVIMMMRETVASLLIQPERFSRKLLQRSWSPGPGQIRYHNINKVGAILAWRIRLTWPSICWGPAYYHCCPSYWGQSCPYYWGPSTYLQLCLVLKLQVIDCPLSVPLSLSTKLLFGQRLENRKYNICFGIILPPKLIKTIWVEQINYEIVSIVLA